MPAIGSGTAAVVDGQLTARPAVARHLQGSKRKSAAAYCRLAATHT
jgi:hypothetical protein